MSKPEAILHQTTIHTRRYPHRWLTGVTGATLTGGSQVDHRCFLQVAPRCHRFYPHRWLTGVIGASYRWITGASYRWLPDHAKGYYEFGCNCVEACVLSLKDAQSSQASKGWGRVEPGPTQPQSCSESSKCSHLDQLFSLGKQVQGCLSLCSRSHSGTEKQLLELHIQSLLSASRNRLL